MRGWTILSDREPDDLAVIAAAPAYRIDHLELSHQVVMDLNEVRDDRKRTLVNRLIDSAHAAGIREVVVWDHALYELAYYPARFRTGPGGTLDLDDPAFWTWLKQDYRDMLDRVPAADGVVLTFIETGARAERQQSRVMTTPQEKLAAVVNAVAEVVIGAPQTLALRPEPGTYQMVIKVTGRDESRLIGVAWDAACVELDEAAGDGEPEYPAQPEPVEHWWVSFLTVPP